MRRSSAAASSAAFLLVGPGVTVGLVPWWITGWRVAEPPWPVPVRALGALLVVAGATAAVHSFARFVLEGAGTPVPIAPPERLVVGGLYRHVRNPMYVAFEAAIAGQALWLGRASLLLYAAAMLAAQAAFVRWYEEPTLLARYGADYAAYRRAVRGWWPRLRPWREDNEGRR